MRGAEDEVRGNSEDDGELLEPKATNGEANAAADNLPKSRRVRMPPFFRISVDVS